MRTVALVVTLCSLARLGHADPDEPAPPPPAPAPENPAATLFEQGRALLTDNQPGAACEKFDASLKLEPEALGTILNLGLCSEQLDRIATALRWFRRVQVRASELSKPDAELAAKEKAALLAIQVPTIKIAFSHPAPRGTTIAVDGAKVDEIDFNRIEVDAGTHEVVATAPGLPAQRETVTLADRESRTVTIAVAAPLVPQRIVTVDRGGSQRNRAYLIAGVGAALLVADTTLALIARHEFQATDVLATRDRWQNVARYGATTLFVAGGAALGTAIYLYLRAPGKESLLVPVVAPDQVGLSFSNRF